MAEPTEEQWVAIQGALANQQMIQAIKLYREATGADLVEAKTAVEKRQAELRSTLPSSSEAPRRAGCLGVIVLGAALILCLRLLLKP